MPRIPAALLESIKRDLSCVSVLEGRGAVFNAHGGGGDVVCRCPFHDDRTPSLVVSVGKNLWRCHGACGVGGDVIALMQKLNGVSFRHAVELAAAGVPALATAFSFAAAEGDDLRSETSRRIGNGASRHLNPPLNPPKFSSARLLPCPLDSTADDGRLMQQVVDYYAGRLAVPGNAGRAYLAERGLDDAELIRRFSLGFADRSLGLRLPNKQRKEGAELRRRLESIGLFRASGHEHFAGSIVVPIHGDASHGADAGAVVGMYGRKVTAGLRSGTPLHTYLPGKHRGLWNAGPGLVNADGAVVICEALIDALSFWVSGVRNVTAAYGVNGFTEDHWAALKTGKARDVFIAYDADAAGDAAAARLAEELIARGLTAFRVMFPVDQDANAVLTARDGGKAALADVLRSAVWVGGCPPQCSPHGQVGDRTAAQPTTQPAAKEESMDAAAVPALPVLAEPAAAASSFAATAFPSARAASTAASTTASTAASASVALREDGADLWTTIGTRQWRVRGLDKNRGSEVLKVNLRVTVQTAASGAAITDRLHVDTVDLYQNRQRQAFIAAAAQETGLHTEVIKSDLGQVLLALECWQIERAKRAAAEASVTAAAATDAVPTMSSDDATAALALLKDPDLTGRIIADLTCCGLVGEATNKLVAYLAASSRKLASPLAVVVQSSSAAGKSTLMDRVLSFMPPEDVRQYSAISGKSPFYLGTANLKHRILAIAEEEGARRASYALKLLQSDGFLSMAATGKDPESGRLVTQDYRVEGPVMLMLTTTAIDVDPELLNRCVVLTVDEDAAQTAAIQQAQRQAHTLAGLTAKRERAAIEALHQNAQRLLRPLTVVNPHAPALSFAANQTRLRRDHAKYLALIDAVAFVHQHQRTVKTHRFADGTTLDYIEVTAADIALANQLAAAVLMRSLDDLPPQTRRFLNHLQQWVTTSALETTVATERFAFTRRQVREALGCGQTQAALHLERLATHEFITPLRTTGDGQISRYCLTWNGGGCATGGLGLVEVPTVAVEATAETTEVTAETAVESATPAAAPEVAAGEAPVGMTETCRDFTAPVGVLSGLGPTGENVDEISVFAQESSRCREFGAHDSGDTVRGATCAAVTSYPVADHADATDADTALAV